MKKIAFLLLGISLIIGSSTFAQNELKVVGDTENTGTEIRFKPSTEIFAITEYSYDILAKRLRCSAVLVV